MRNIGLGLVLIFLVGCSGGEKGYRAAPEGGSAESMPSATDVGGAKLGTVVLTDSCEDAVRPDLERGLALLHSMTYEEAASAFAQAAETDPGCALAYWGQAMTFVHPLWSDPPDSTTFARGAALVEQARERAANEKERAYVEALAGYYDAGRTGTERPNLVGFEAGWRQAHEAFPDDPEGAAFYALAQLATVDPADKTFSKQRAAGGLAEQVLAAVPDHPGAHHYIIHAYDNPVLSANAVHVARSYGGVAPEVPHALHMPTHTFTRLGLWQESIDWNRRSADAALQRPVGRQTSLHYFHALDYLAYAYLQGAEDAQAEDVLRELERVEPPYQAHLASAYAFAAIPARLVLERHMWEAAANLRARIPPDYPWDTAAASEAMSHFARALGAARTGRFDEARSSLERLSEIKTRLDEATPYWATQTEIQRLSALAWLQFEEGRREEGLSTMRAAADLESRTEKHPVSPGEVLPARELLADMLLELGRPDQALGEYEAALNRSPNRFNSLYGAGRAAELSGDTQRAAAYFRALLAVCANADTERERLRHAREYIGATGLPGT